MPRRMPRTLFLSPLLAAIALFGLVLHGGCGRRGDTSSDGVAASTKTPATLPAVRPWTMRPLPEGQVNFLLCGDWGTEDHLQKEVAAAMVDYVRAAGIQFDAFLVVGDNFYTKLPSVNDYRWQGMFEDMYDASVLNFPFYVVLGNHDYEQTKAQVQLEYARKNPHSRWKMPAKWFRVDFPEHRDPAAAASAGPPLASVIFLDSNKIDLTAEEWSQQMVFLERNLADRRGARWLIVVAHHPFFSNGSHGDHSALQAEWGPLVRQHKVDFYINGHDHDLQHLEIDGWPCSFLLVGAGARPVTSQRRDDRGPFSKKAHGFAAMKLTADEALVTYVGSKDGKVLHQFRKPPGGKPEILRSVGRDVVKPPKGGMPATIPTPATVP